VCADLRLTRFDGLYQTGSGKTAGFFPIIMSMIKNGGQGPPGQVRRVDFYPSKPLVLAPTRELAQQDSRSYPVYLCDGYCGSHLQVPTLVNSFAQKLNGW
jgi:hypothetical protein